jgi:dienelactone hydrolase
MGGMANAGEKVVFPGAKAVGYDQVEEVSAELDLPKDAKDRVPAVIILHGSGGIDGRGQFHAQALNAAGIATLEVYMFARGNRPKEGLLKTLTHGYGALKYLASRSDIDPQRIGVMGFSWGGSMSMRMASKSVSDAFLANTNGLRFAAHVPFYPVCWNHARIMRSGMSDYRAFTGAAVLLFAGGQDDYDSPDDCKNFLDALPEQTRSHMTLQFYPEATHGWDSQSDRARTFYDQYAFGGRGGQVRFTPDRAIAEDSRKRMVEFFMRTFKMGQ